MVSTETAVVAAVVLAGLDEVGASVTADRYLMMGGTLFHGPPGSIERTPIASSETVVSTPLKPSHGGKRYGNPDGLCVFLSCPEDIRLARVAGWQGDDE